MLYRWHGERGALARGRQHEPSRRVLREAEQLEPQPMGCSNLGSLSKRERVEDVDVELGKSHWGETTDDRESFARAEFVRNRTATSFARSHLANFFAPFSGQEILAAKSAYHRC